MKKLIFMGTPDFSATVLKGLLESGQYEVLAVVWFLYRFFLSENQIQITKMK